MMTGRLTYVFSVVLLLLTTGFARCANRLATAPPQRSAVLASPSNQARLHLMIEPVVSQDDGRLHVVLAIGKTVTVAWNAAGLLLNHCLPNRNLQERELNILHFLSLRGPAVLESIRSGIQTSGFFHHVLQLE